MTENKILGERLFFKLRAQVKATIQGVPENPKLLK
jgi:hypothetical protein